MKNSIYDHAFSMIQDDLRHCDKCGKHVDDHVWKNQVGFYTPSSAFADGDRTLSQGEYLSRICASCGKPWGKHVSPGLCKKEAPMETPETPKPLTAVVYVSRKLNDRDYGHGEVFIGLSGITADTTPDEMDEMLEQQSLAFGKLRDVLRDRVMQITKLHP